MDRDASGAGWKISGMSSAGSLAKGCRERAQKSAGVKSFAKITQGLKPYMGQ